MNRKIPRQKPPTLWSQPVNEVQPWHRVGQHSDEHPWLTSATDLLVSWMPGSQVQMPPEAPPGATQPGWDDYFAFDPGEATPAEAVLDEPWAAEAWDPAAAQDAVACFFAFLHALERFDIAAAMACVAADYRSMERDLEIDRHALQLRLETMLDRWRAGNLRLSPCEVPDPIFHPEGVLIHTTLQVDHLRASDSLPVTDLMERVFLLNQGSDGRHRISAISIPVEGDQS